MESYRSGINKRPWRVGMAQGALPPSPPKPMCRLGAWGRMGPCLPNGRLFIPDRYHSLGVTS